MSTTTTALVPVPVYKRALSVLSLLIFIDLSAQTSQIGDSCRLLTFIPFTDSRNAPVLVVPPSRAQQEGPPPGTQQGGPPQGAQQGGPGPAIDVKHGSVKSNSGYGYGEWPDAETLAKASFSMMAAAEMARRHFNARDSSIVPQLRDLQATCNITMPEPEANVSYINSAYDRLMVIIEVLKYGSGGNAVPGNICSIIGPSDLLSIAAAAVVTQNAQIPHITYQTENWRFGSRDEFPNLVRMQTSTKNWAAAVIRYIFKGGLNRDSAAIIYDENDYGTEFGEFAYIQMESLVGFRTIRSTFAQRIEPSFHKALEIVANEGYRTIVFVTDRPAILDNVAPLADKLGLLGEGYVWFLIGATLPIDVIRTLKYKVDSSIDRLLRGAGIFTNYDPFAYVGEADSFLTAWRRQDDSIVKQLNRVQPTNDHGGPFFVANSSYFQTEIPAKYASFIYDAVIISGISACSARNNSIVTTNRRFTCIEEMLTTTFSGASGPVKFQYANEDVWNSRDGDGVMYGLYNIRPGDVVDENNTRSYEAVLTSVYRGNNSAASDEGSGETGPFSVVVRGTWANVKGGEFLYFDGTTTQPMPTRTVFNAHYISKPIHITGLVLAGLALFIIAAAAFWVAACRNAPLVRAAQPLFLCLLCFGAALVASSGIFLSFDEDKGKSQSQLNSFCSTFTWFFVVGYLTMYCALLGKLWRLSKLLQMRRRIVHVRHVILGPAVIVAASLVVLAAWQITDPFVWERKVISQDPLETYGQCYSFNHGTLAFGIPLALLMVVTVLITAALSWKLRSVQSDLAESQWICAGIFLQIQTWLVGVPVLYITDSVSKDAYYMMVVSLTFTLSTSMVMLVVGPKMFAWARSKGFCVCAVFNDASTTSISIGRDPKTHISGLQNVSSVNQTSNTNIFNSSVSKSMPFSKSDTSDSRNFDGSDSHTSGLPDPFAGHGSSNAQNMEPFCTAPSLKVDDGDCLCQIAELEKQGS